MRVGTVGSLEKELGTEFKFDEPSSFETVTGTYREKVKVPSVPFEIEIFHLSADAHDQLRFQRRQRSFPAFMLSSFKIRLLGELNQEGRNAGRARSGLLSSMLSCLHAFLIQNQITRFGVRVTVAKLISKPCLRFVALR